MTIKTNIRGDDLDGFRWHLSENGREIASSSTCDDRMPWSSAVACATAAQRNLGLILTERRTKEAAPALLRALRGLLAHPEPLPQPKEPAIDSDWGRQHYAHAAARDAALAALALVDQPPAKPAQPAAIPTERLGTLATIQRHATMAGALHQLVDDARAHDSALDAEPDPQSPTGDDYNDIMAMIEAAASAAGLERA